MPLPLMHAPSQCILYWLCYRSGSVGQNYNWPLFLLPEIKLSVWCGKGSYILRVTPSQTVCSRKQFSSSSVIPWKNLGNASSKAQYIGMPSVSTKAYLKKKSILISLLARLFHVVLGRCPGCTIAPFLGQGWALVCNDCINLISCSDGFSVFFRSQVNATRGIL